MTDRERVAVALFERWEDEGEADPGRSENYERAAWQDIPEDDRDHWRGWADAALAALSPTGEGRND
jgi:hypothetical protein